MTLFGSFIASARPAGARLRPAFLFLVSLVLPGCAPPESPLLIEPGPPPAGDPAPAWLPAGYTRDPAPNPFAADRAATELYTPAGALAPVVMVSRWTPTEAARLAPDPLGWLHERLPATLQPGNELGSPKAWDRPELAGGWRYPVSNSQWGEADRGMLAGEAAIGRTRTGGLLLVAVLEPIDGDRSLVEEVMGRVPVE